MSSVGSFEPVKFSVELEDRPNLSKIQQLEVNRLPPESYRDMAMDDQTLNLAKQQVLARLRVVTVLDWKSWFGVGNESDIDIVSVIVDGESDRPCEMQLKSFPKVQKGASVSIDPDYPVMMYERAGKVPRYLDIRILVARNRQGVRNVGEAMLSITNNNYYKSAVQTLSSLVTGPIGAVLGQVDAIVGTIGAILKLQADDQLLYYAGTLSRDFDKLGIGPHDRTTKFVEFSYVIQAGPVREFL